MKLKFALIFPTALPAFPSARNLVSKYLFVGPVLERSKEACLSGEPPYAVTSGIG